MKMGPRNPTFGMIFTQKLLQNPEDNEILYLAVQTMEKNKTKHQQSFFLLFLSLIITTTTTRQKI